MSRKTRTVLKAGVWVACLLPLACLVYWAAVGELTANPIDFVTDTLGIWALRLLLASLALTPLRLVSGAAWPVAFRRLLGLFAFFYAVLHLGVWALLDHFLDWPRMLADLLGRRYITAGLLALLLLLPLAATSTGGMVRRLGGRGWRRLHRLVYPAALLAVLHYLWLAKPGFRPPVLYAAVLALLLGIRLWGAARRRLARAGCRSSGAPGAR